MKKMTPKITKNKTRWAKNRDTYLVGTPLYHSAAIGARYEKELRTLVRKMTVRTRSQIDKLFKGEPAKVYFTLDASITNDAKKLLKELKSRFVTLFADRSIVLAKKMIDETSRYSKTTLKKSLEQLTGGLAVTMNFIPAAVKEVTDASIVENVSLIKSIPEEYFTKITGAVMRSITSGQGADQLMRHFKKYAGITDRRAKNIALDQTRKAYNDINAARMVSSGYEKFRWLHSGGGLHPRKSHVAMNGEIFRFDNLPIINKEQVDAGTAAPEQGLPAQAPNCGCTMQPVYKMPEIAV